MTRDPSTSHQTSKRPAVVAVIVVAVMIGVTVYLRWARSSACGALTLDRCLDSPDLRTQPSNCRAVLNSFRTTSAGSTSGTMDVADCHGYLARVITSGGLISLGALCWRIDRARNLGH